MLRNAFLIAFKFLDQLLILFIYEVIKITRKYTSKMSTEFTSKINKLLKPFSTYIKKNINNYSNFNSYGSPLIMDLHIKNKIVNQFLY